MKKLEDILSVENVDITQTSPITLAFLGDAVHTMLVRSWFLRQNMQKVNNLHTSSSKLCSAKGQAMALDSISEILTEEEKNIVRRARNAKTHKPPKNCELEVYKKATSYEALIGFLVIKKKYERLEELFLRFVTTIFIAK